MKTVSKFKTALLIAPLAALAATAAQAGVIHNFGTLTTVPAVFNLTDPAGAISDIFNFTISATDVNASLSAVSLTLPFPGTASNLFHISNFAGVIDDSLSNPIGSLTLQGGSYVFSGILSAGNYSLNTSGTADGIAGGNYTVAMAAAPVPEPSTAIAAIAGLGLLTLVLRRRRQDEI